MKYFPRFLSVFLCLVSLFLICCVPVSASEVDTTSYHIFQENMIETPSGSASLGSFIFYPHNGTVETKSLTYSHGAYTTANTLSNGNSKFTTLYSLAYDDNSIMLEKGKTYKVTLSNVYFSCLVNANTPYYLRKPISCVAYVTSRDGVTMPVNSVDFNYQEGQPYLDIVITVTPEYDISKLEFGVSARFADKFPSYSSNYIVTLEHYFGEYNGDDKFQFALEVESQETGVLKSILGSLTSGLDNLFQGITNVFNAITELPSKIWGFIENGLKSLFVPSEEYFLSYKTKWDNLLADRLGAVYEVVQITFGAWGDITASDETNTIAMPLVSIPLSDTEFSFGGYDVKIVPDGFDFITTPLKLIVGIACSFLFVNGLRKRYDEIMGVEQ